MECVICLDDIFAESASCIPCGHVYHTKCIRPWLKTKKTCPLCSKFFKKSNLIRLYLCNGGSVNNNAENEESSDEEEAPAPPPDPMPSTSRGNQRSPVRAQRWTYLVRQRQQRPYFHNSLYSPLPTIPTPDFEAANYLMNEPPRPYRPLMSLSPNPPPQRPSRNHSDDYGRDGNRIQFSASVSFPSSSSSNGNIPGEYSIRFDAQPPNEHRGIPGYPTWRNYQQPQPPPSRPSVMVNDWDVSGGFPPGNSYGGNIQAPQNLHPGPSMIHPNGQNNHHAQNIHQGGQNMHHGGQNIHQGGQNIHQGGQNMHQAGMHPQNLHQPGTSSQNANLLHNNPNQQGHYQGGQFGNHGQMQNPQQRR